MGQLAHDGLVGALLSLRQLPRAVEMAGSLDFSDVEGSQDEEVHVTLPCTPDRFAEFIAGLLGRPQKITRRFRFLFHIAQNEVESLHYLLVQRITQQNQATLVQFVATVTFHDKSSVRMNSFDDFCNYNEVRPLRSSSLTLSWIFLIRFHDRHQPEKQEINVRFAIPRSTDDYEFYGYDYDFFPFGRHLVESYAPGSVFVEINYTARTWANDIDNLTKGHMDTLKNHDDPVFHFIHRKSSWIGWLTAVFIITTGLFGLWQYDKYLGDMMDNQIGELVHLESTSELIIQALRVIADKGDREFVPILATILLLVGATVLAFFTASVADGLGKESSLRLTREDTKKSAEDRVVFRRKVATFIFLLIVNVCLGLGMAVLGKLFAGNVI